jgi:hypothetical protein
MLILSHLGLIIEATFEGQVYGGAQQMIINRMFLESARLEVGSNSSVSVKDY